MTAPRCRFCRKTDGILIYQAPDADYRSGRRNYRAQGFGPSRYHADCLAAYERFDAESKARHAAEFAAMVAEARSKL